MMREWLVKFRYEGECRDGFDHDLSTEYVVGARTGKDALKKAEAMLMKEAKVQGILDYKVVDMGYACVDIVKGKPLSPPEWKKP